MSGKVGVCCPVGRVQKGPGNGPGPDERYMRLALEEALKAAAVDEVPVGAVVVDSSGVVASAHNLRRSLNDPTAHAEILALREAARLKGTWHLSDCTLYVTLEPCPMCAGALVNARVGTLVYGAADPKAGACGTLYTITNDPRLNHEVRVISGVLQDECAEVLRQFFSRLRAHHRAED